MQILDIYLVYALYTICRQSQWKLIVPEAHPNISLLVKQSSLSATKHHKQHVTVVQIGFEIPERSAGY